MIGFPPQLPQRFCLSLTTALTLCASTMLVAEVASAQIQSPFVLDFEGLSDFESIGSFYAGGEGSDGSISGYDFGITFSDNALALLDADAGGQSGNFGGEATPDTILFFRGPSANDPNQRDAAIMNVADGFLNGFSVFYSAITAPGQVNIYDSLDAQGTLLASFDLPLTPRNGAPDPTGEFSPFVPIGGTFEGIARSISFEGAARRIGFDNVTIGAAQPLPGFTSEYPFLKPEKPPVKKVPESGTTLALVSLLAGWRLLRHRQKAQS